MRLERATKRGVVWQSSFKRQPSQETIDALDAIAEAVAKLAPSSPESSGPTPEEPSDEPKTD